MRRYNPRYNLIQCRGCHQEVRDVDNTFRCPACAAKRTDAQALRDGGEKA